MNNELQPHTASHFVEVTCVAPSGQVIFKFYNDYKRFHKVFCFRKWLLKKLKHSQIY